VRLGATTSPLVSYEAILVAIAVAYPVTARVRANSRVRLSDRVLGDTRVVGLSGLQLVLAVVLNDPGLQIVIADESLSPGVVEAARAPSSRQRTRTLRALRVVDGDELLAEVVTRAPAVADRPTADAIVAAVRLAVVNHRLREQRTQRLADVQAVRERLLAAADRERDRVAAELRHGAGAHLRDALAEFRSPHPADESETSRLIDFAGIEVAAAAEEVERIVAGVPPTALGSGRLRVAIAALAARSPLPLTVDIGEDTAATVAVETALFYVSSEALANATKHADATHIVIDLTRHGDRLSLSVMDDGRGGADPSGSGLLGLADRLAVVGGTLTVDSPIGAATVVTATVPIGGR
jgi:signal transduction histidine kinase